MSFLQKSPSLVFEQIGFDVPERGAVLLNGSVASAERVVLRGPSGCGKTTLLRMLAGLVPKNSGRLWLGAQDLNSIAPQKLGCGLVFQSGALFSHLSVFENVVFGLRHAHSGWLGRELSDELIEQKGIDFLKRVGLESLAARDVSRLSGGERQRVALARALIVEPSYLLLDEPLSAVDPERRTSLQEWILERLVERPIPTVIVSHDTSEARTLGTRVVTWDSQKMKEGAVCVDF